MKLIAKKPLRYAGRSLDIGDEFEASDRDGRTLKAIGKAEDAPASESVKRTPKGRGTRVEGEPNALTESQE